MENCALENCIDISAALDKELGKKETISDIWIRGEVCTLPQPLADIVYTASLMYGYNITIAATRMYLGLDKEGGIDDELWKVSTVAVRSKSFTFIFSHALFNLLENCVIC